MIIRAGCCNTQIIFNFSETYSNLEIMSMVPDIGVGLIWEELDPVRAFHVFIFRKSRALDIIRAVRHIVGIPKIKKIWSELNNMIKRFLARSIFPLT